MCNQYQPVFFQLSRLCSGAASAQLTSLCRISTAHCLRSPCALHNSRSIAHQSRSRSNVVSHPAARRHPSWWCLREGQGSSDSRLLEVAGANNRIVREGCLNCLLCKFQLLGAPAFAAHGTANLFCNIALDTRYQSGLRSRLSIGMPQTLYISRTLDTFMHESVAKTLVPTQTVSRPNWTRPAAPEQHAPPSPIGRLAPAWDPLAPRTHHHEGAQVRGEVHAGKHAL